MSKDYKSKFENKGRYQKIRNSYFKQRSPEREKEIKELYRDVDYLIAELHHLEKRMRIGGLVSFELEATCMKLRFMEDRHKYRSDLECLNKIAEEFNRCYGAVRLSVFSKGAETLWWLNEVKAGEEVGLEDGVDSWADRHICPLCRRKFTHKEKKNGLAGPE